MENQSGNNQPENSKSGFKSFAAKRIILAAILIIVVVWVLGLGLNIFKRSPDESTNDRPQQHQTADVSATHQEAHPSDAQTLQEHPAAPESQHHSQDDAAASHSETAAAAAEHAGENDSHESSTGAASHGTDEHASPPAASPHGHAEQAQTHAQPADTEAHTGAVGHEAQSEAAPHAAETPSHETHQTRGVAFVEAVIKPLDYELNKRFWGWRPNDILNFTDNTNNFQLGVLEVTRRSTVMLTDRISRTGSTDRLDPHLEDASNWLMITATRYWFPSPESKYEECIKELKAYKEELIKGDAFFYIRADNLIPLLASYEDLLGSCDDNLVKQKNADGSRVSFFKADDYFFYAKGVTSAMATILEAVHHEFLPTLESRHGTELLHHAVMSCRQAAALSPLFITNTDLDGIFANHRANMAAPISHARYYIGQLIKTLST